MPRMRNVAAKECIPTSTGGMVISTHPPVEQGLLKFWDGLSIEERQNLLRVDRKELFTRIRAQYCSRCFGLFQLRYDELRSSATLECSACHACYAGLAMTDDGALTLEETVLHSRPFSTFAESTARERERDMQFVTGDVCGSGWMKKPGQNSCRLHTSPVPYEVLADYWANLPQEHRSTLFQMCEEDFVAELDAHLKYHLKICKDCRGNVMRAFKELKPARDGTQQFLKLCEGHEVTILDGMVLVNGPMDSAFFEKAEEVEELKMFDPENLDADFDGPEQIRHAETPELAREVLQDCVLLIFKAQMEGACRDQTAGHNALLLFVQLALGMMEQQLVNAHRELRVKRAEAELLELVQQDARRKGDATPPKPAQKKPKKKAQKHKCPKACAGAADDAHAEECDAACPQCFVAQLLPSDALEAPYARTGSNASTATTGDVHLLGSSPEDAGSPAEGSCCLDTCRAADALPRERPASCSVKLQLPQEEVAVLCIGADSGSEAAACPVAEVPPAAAAVTQRGCRGQGGAISRQKPDQQRPLNRRGEDGSRVSTRPAKEPRNGLRRGRGAAAEAGTGVVPAAVAAAPGAMPSSMHTWQPHNGGSPIATAPEPPAGACPRNAAGLHSVSHEHGGGGGSKEAAQVTGGNVGDADAGAPGRHQPHRHSPAEKPCRGAAPPVAVPEGEEPPVRGGRRRSGTTDRAGSPKTVAAAAVPGGPGDHTPPLRTVGSETAGQPKLSALTASLRCISDDAPVREALDIEDARVAGLAAAAAGAPVGPDWEARGGPEAVHYQQEGPRSRGNSITGPHPHFPHMAGSRMPPPDFPGPVGGNWQGPWWQPGAGSPPMWQPYASSPPQQQGAAWGCPPGAPWNGGWDAPGAPPMSSRGPPHENHHPQAAAAPPQWHPHQLNNGAMGPPGAPFPPPDGPAWHPGAWQGQPPPPPQQLQQQQGHPMHQMMPPQAPAAPNPQYRGPPPPPPPPPQPVHPTNAPVFRPGPPPPPPPPPARNPPAGPSILQHAMGIAPGPPPPPPPPRQPRLVTAQSMPQPSRPMSPRNQQHPTEQHPTAPRAPPPGSAVLPDALPTPLGTIQRSASFENPRLPPRNPIPPSAHFDLGRPQTPNGSACYRTASCTAAFMSTAAMDRPVPPPPCKLTTTNGSITQPCAAAKDPTVPPPPRPVQPHPLLASSPSAAFGSSPPGPFSLFSHFPSGGQGSPQRPRPLASSTDRPRARPPHDGDDVFDAVPSYQLFGSSPVVFNPSLLTPTLLT